MCALQDLLRPMRSQTETRTNVEVNCTSEPAVFSIEISSCRIWNLLANAAWLCYSTIFSTTRHRDECRNWYSHKLFRFLVYYSIICSDSDKLQAAEPETMCPNTGRASWKYHGYDEVNIHCWGETCGSPASWPQSWDTTCSHGLLISRFGVQCVTFGT